MALISALGWGSSSGCSAENPFDFGGPRSCEVTDQNEWVYGLMQEAYLFSDDLAEIDPTTYETPHAMVSDLRVEPDRWSRVSDKARTDALFQEGKFIGLGFRTKRDTAERVVVADIYASSPASAEGMRRGDIIRSIGGFTTEEIDEESRWSEIYGENIPGVVVDLEVEQEDGSTRELTLAKDWIAIETVPNTRVLEVEGRPVGYLQFSTFVDTAPAALDASFSTFRAAGVREVIVDIRYNGGGLVAVARHFMHLLVGAIAEGHIAYQVRYNDAFADQNTERELMRLDSSLPALDHVVFITTGNSLSASELLINAVSSHVPVSLVGGTTGGKPVGSKHFDFCDSVAVPITFRLLNAEGKGDYYDGLRADCPASDDFGHALGDPDEASLAVALHLLATGQCLPDPAAEEAQADPLGGLRATPEPMGGDVLPAFALVR